MTPIKNRKKEQILLHNDKRYSRGVVLRNLQPIRTNSVFSVLSAVLQYNKSLLEFCCDFATGRDTLRDLSTKLVPFSYMVLINTFLKKSRSL